MNDRDKPEVLLSPKTQVCRGRYAGRRRGEASPYHDWGLVESAGQRRYPIRILQTETWCCWRSLRTSFEKKLFGI